MQPNTVQLTKPCCLFIVFMELSKFPLINSRIKNCLQSVRNVIIVFVGFFMQFAVTPQLFRPMVENKIPASYTETGRAINAVMNVFMRSIAARVFAVLLGSSERSSVRHYEIWLQHLRYVSSHSRGQVMSVKSAPHKEGVI